MILLNLEPVLTINGTYRVWFTGLGIAGFELVTFAISLT